MVTKVTRYLVFFGFLMITLIPVSSQALVINEVHFNPSIVSDNDGEFLELYNEETGALDLTGYTIQGITVNFNGLLIGAGGFMVFASEAVDNIDTDMDSFETIYGNGDGLLTEFPFPVVDFSGSLANTGEALILYGPDGMVVDRYNYTPFIGSGSDGGGFSIERLDPGGPSVDSNFRVSEISGGTPGMWNSVSGTSPSGDATPVPEPATFLLMVTGLFLMAWKGDLLRT